MSDNFELQLKSLTRFYDILSCNVLLKRETLDTFVTGDFRRVISIFEVMHPTNSCSQNAEFPNVSISLPDREDTMSLLYIACKYGNFEVVRRLLEYPSTISSINKEAELGTLTGDPVMAAINIAPGENCNQERLKCVRRLLETCAVLHDKKMEYLFVAITVGAWRVVDHLLRWIIPIASVRERGMEYLVTAIHVQGVPCDEHSHLKSCFTLGSSERDRSCTRGCTECAFLCYSLLLKALKCPIDPRKLQLNTIGKRFGWHKERARAYSDPSTWKHWKRTHRYD